MIGPKRLFVVEGRYTIQRLTASGFRWGNYAEWDSLDKAKAHMELLRAKPQDYRYRLLQHAFEVLEDTA